MSLLPPPERRLPAAIVKRTCIHLLTLTWRPWSPGVTVSRGIAMTTRAVKRTCSKRPTQVPRSPCVANNTKRNDLCRKSRAMRWDQVHCFDDWMNLMNMIFIFRARPLAEGPRTHPFVLKHQFPGTQGGNKIGGYRSQVTVPFREEDGIVKV